MPSLHKFKDFVVFLKMGKKKANTTSENKEVAPRTDPRAKEELRQKLKSKIGEKQIQRSSKDHRKKVWEETLTDFGLDD